MIVSPCSNPLHRLHIIKQVKMSFKMNIKLLMHFSVCTLGMITEMKQVFFQAFRISCQHHLPLFHKSVSAYPYFSDILTAIWTAVLGEFLYTVRKLCYNLCWCECCFSWGQNPWKHDGLLVRYTSLSAHCSSGKPCSQWKRFLRG